MSAFDGMQPTFRHTPPGCSRSTTTVFTPSCPRRMPHTYPPGPLPITTASARISLIVFPSLQLVELLAQEPGRLLVDVLDDARHRRRPDLFLLGHDLAHLCFDVGRHPLGLTRGEP